MEKIIKSVKELAFLSLPMPTTGSMEISKTS
jgi:hypothetical protein